MGQKVWGPCPFWGGGAGSPSTTMWTGPRPTSMPSFILIHPTVWPQYSNITDKTDKQTDNGLIASGKPLYKRSPKNGPQGEPPVLQTTLGQSNVEMSPRSLIGKLESLGLHCLRDNSLADMIENQLMRDTRTHSASKTV